VVEVTIVMLFLEPLFDEKKVANGYQDECVLAHKACDPKKSSICLIHVSLVYWTMGAQH
jgi:hypothetical protein